MFSKFGIFVLVSAIVFSCVPVLAANQSPLETLSTVEKLNIVAHANDTTTAILQSSDGAYQWKFVKYNATSAADAVLSDRRLLAVINTQYNTTVIWIANRNNPVSQNATLSVQLDKTKNSTTRARIVLADAVAQNQSNVVWSSPAGVHSVEMNYSGNLVMKDSSGNLLWQSFDDPTDVMVPGQFIRAGHNVTAGLAWNDITAGNYSLNVEIGGAVLYATFDAQQSMVPYRVLGYVTGVNGTLNDTLHSACNNTVLIYNSDATGVHLEQRVETPNGTLTYFETPQCQAEDLSTHGITFANRLQGDGFRFLRLMPTGDANSFLLDSTGLHLDNELFKGFFSTYCKLPSYCGENSICSSVSTCTCPTLFSQIDDSDPRKGCSLRTPLNCSIATQHQFLPVTGVDYYANPYFTPHIVSSAAECTDLCLPNCSCTTAFYNNQTGDCYLYDTVQTMQSGASPYTTAYLRVAKLPPSPSVSSGPLLSKKAIAGVSVGGAAFMIALLLLGVWAGRKFMKSQNDDDSDDEEEAFLESLPGLPPRYSYKELQTATESFSKQLGKGGSGAVYEGRIDPRPARLRQSHNLLNNKEIVLIRVAVKELQVTERSTLASANKKQFRAEVATLGGLSHINLVQLKGFCTEGSHRVLIYEFLENGSLDRWIFSADPKEVLPWEKRYRIAVDTARGLAFLHEGSRDKVMHLDVKPQNILLDRDFRAKLADFGLAKLMDRGENNQTLTAIRGTPGYMAPEWFLNLPVTEKSDVFSFGMVLLEIVGGRKNVSLELDSDDDWYFPAWAVKQAENGNLVDIVDKRLLSGQEELDKECETNMCRLAQVAFWCIQEGAASRPSMSNVLLMLEKHVETPSPPLDLTYVLRRQPKPQQMLQQSTSSSSVSRMNESGVLEIMSALEAR